jgi:hypothetical protein
VRWLGQSPFRPECELVFVSMHARKPGICSVHGEVEFVQRSDSGTWRCVPCRAEAVTVRRRRVKAILVADAGGACIACGYNRCLAALQFHHVRPAEKQFALGRKGVARSLEKARAEARKCVLL